MMFHYENTIREWFNEKIKAEDFTDLYQAIMKYFQTEKAEMADQILCLNLMITFFRLLL